MFSTAGRTVKSGLVASAVVPSWTWAATLLRSSAVAYSYGVSGPFWYASGATVQIILFATIAIELKRRAPNAHTFLEVIRARYGAVTHIVFMVFGLFTSAYTPNLRKTLVWDVPALNIPPGPISFSRYSKVITLLKHLC
jgi:Na+/proline symporter